MRRIVPLFLYTALALGAIPAAAGPDLEPFRAGAMKKLLVHDAPKPAPDTAFLGEDGSRMSLRDLAGRHALVNFWATWCAPCRQEMPSLDALQREFGGDAFQVVTIATGRNPEAAIDRFFREAGIGALPRHTDPTQALARDMGILGLPVTVILDPSGREIARLRGDADWHSDEARGLVAALTGP